MLICRSFLPAYSCTSSLKVIPFRERCCLYWSIHERVSHIFNLFSIPTLKLILLLRFHSLNLLLLPTFPLHFPRKLFMVQIWYGVYVSGRVFMYMIDNVFKGSYAYATTVSVVRRRVGWYSAVVDALAKEGQQIQNFHIFFYVSSTA